MEEGIQLRSSLPWLGQEELHSTLRGDGSVRLVFCKHRDRCVTEVLLPFEEVNGDLWASPMVVTGGAESPWASWRHGLCVREQGWGREVIWSSLIALRGKNVAAGHRFSQAPRAKWSQRGCETHQQVDAEKERCRERCSDGG